MVKATLFGNLILKLGTVPGVKLADRQKIKMPLRDIENHLERADARIKRFEQIEAIEARNNLINLVIRLTVGMVAVLCAISAIYNQF